MRQRLGPRQLRKVEELVGMPVEKVLVRGNTGHRRDVFLKEGGLIRMWPDGDMQLDGFNDLPGDEPSLWSHALINK